MSYVRGVLHKTRLIFSRINGPIVYEIDSLAIAKDKRDEFNHFGTMAKRQGRPLSSCSINIICETNSTVNRKVKD